VPPWRPGRVPCRWTCRAVSSSVSVRARVLDFLLGGKDNFEADRQQARNVLEVYPQAAELVIQARQFQARAVTYAAQQHIGQFLDIGCGLPTAPNTRLAPFMIGLDLIAPGILPARQWRAPVFVPG
jgi:hypothetical protein